MSNEEIISKMREDMKMRGFSHYTKEQYEIKTKHLMKYLNKPLEEVTVEELRNYLLKHLREEKGLSERSVNYYNSVIRFVYVLRDTFQKQVAKIIKYIDKNKRVIESSFFKIM